MSRKWLSIAVITSLSFISGCYYDIEEELYGVNGNCDTTNITYSGIVAPLIQQYGCIGCHSSSSPSGNVILDNYNGVRSVASDGRLFGAINHSAGYTPMPQGGNKLTACEINKIKAWIDNGAANN